MATKWKKGKPLAGWLCFFCSISLVIVLLLGLNTIPLFESLTQAKNQGTLSDLFCTDVRDTKQFHQKMNTILHEFLNYTASKTHDDSEVRGYLESPQSILFTVRNWVDRKGDLSNTDLELSMDNPPTGYRYILSLINGELTYFKDGQEIPLAQIDFPNDSSFRLIDEFKNENSAMLSSNYRYLKEHKIVLAFRDDFTLPDQSGLYQISQDYLRLRTETFTFLACCLSALLLFLVYVPLRKSKAKIDRAVAAFTQKLPLLFKLLILLLVSIMIFNFQHSTAILPLIILMWWCGYFLVNDFRYNHFKGQKLLSRSILNLYRRYEAKLPVQKALLLRCVLFIVLELLLVVATLLALFGIDKQLDRYSFYNQSIHFFYGMVSFLVFLFGLALNVLLIWRYFRSFRKAVSDLGKLIIQIDQIHQGRYDAPVAIPEGSLLYPTGQQLQEIQNGFSSSLEEGLKAERMKVELITNVSHDIKTPLTSIISYVDLLLQEKQLPEHVQSYIQILAQKSDRLKNMVQDIFDISKASSGNLVLQLEILDLGTLLKQVLADMDEAIAASTLTVKVSIPETPVLIEADGNHLYRVFQNLLKNALQYSLEHSRVYLTLLIQGPLAVVTVKNTSKYEIQMDSGRLLDRFVRGDASRTTEGSGLGLSIVQSFTEACGGTFSISVNADLFCATVSLPRKEETPLSMDSSAVAPPYQMTAVEQEPHVRTDPVASMLEDETDQELWSVSQRKPSSSP